MVHFSDTTTKHYLIYILYDNPALWPHVFQTLWLCIPITLAVVWAHFVYLYCPISLLHARVSQVFLNTCMRVRGVICSGVCFSLFMVSACYWRGRLCFGRGRDRGFILYISLFLRVLGWWVCVCLYTHVHTHKVLGYLM